MKNIEIAKINAQHTTSGFTQAGVQTRLTQSR